jgi:hypothetical protein
MRAAFGGAGVTRDAGVRLAESRGWACAAGSGALCRPWLERPPARPIKETLAAWALGAVVLDGAGATAPDCWPTCQPPASACHATAVS